MEYKHEEQLEEIKLEYNPSEAEVKVINRVFERFQSMKTERDKQRHELGDKTITEYVNDSMDAYNGIVSEEIKATKEDWQSLIWDHETRGKVKAIVAMVTGNRPFVSLIGENQDAHDYAADMFDVYEDSWLQENGAYKLYKQALSAACKGTVIVEEAYLEEKQMIKSITKVDQQTGKVSFTEKEVIKGGAGQVKAEIVPLLQFYPNENSAEIKHDCAVYKLYSHKAFKNKYGKYPNAEYVVNGVWANGISNLKYKSKIDNANELIEVIKYHNEDFDEMVILSNGVWLNPQKGDKISPIPFDHKSLPYTKTVFELADEECFYGKSFPDILGGEQDTRNALLRLMIDQEILATNKPMLMGTGIEIDSSELYPGKQINVPGDIAQIRELQISGSNQSAFSLLQMLKTSSDVNSSISPTSQGVGSGRKTAREAIILDENAKKISGTFQIFIYKLLKDRAELRISNIAQFYTKPVQYSVLRNKDNEPILKPDGKPSTAPVMREVPVVKPGKNPKWITMKKEMKGKNWIIRLVEDFEVPQNRSTRVETASVLLEESKQNPLLNADAVTIDYLEALGKNPDKFYLKPEQAEMEFQEENVVPEPNQQPIQ